MCGIVGYTGTNLAIPVLIDGLKRLEYRGYDSAGVAFFQNNEISVIKCRGRITALEDRVARYAGTGSTCGIGHTRWATHGEPSDLNSHPHLSRHGSIAVVHNGIIENYAELRTVLAELGYICKTETDTEVIAHLVEYYYKEEGDLLCAVERARIRMHGSYALGILCRDNPGRIVAVRRDCPLIVGRAPDGYFIASDLPAILRYTQTYRPLEEYETAVLTPTSVEIYNADGRASDRPWLTASFDIEAAEKGGYEHFMLKEIMEQPAAVKNTVEAGIENGLPSAAAFGLSDEEIAAVHRIFITACGSAYHAGIVGKNYIEQLAGIPCEVCLASEFRYSNPLTRPDDLCIVISQSGETADSLAALREARRRGMKTLGIVNVTGSSIARESGHVFLTRAGIEIAVATTKAYSAQLAALALAALRFAAARNALPEERLRALSAELVSLPEKIQALLGLQKDVQYIASRIHNRDHIFFLGRGADYSAGLEASLKLKEISYIHSEAYAAGELKHGTISLITPGSLVVALATQPALFEKMGSNVCEVRARGANILSVAAEGFRSEGDDFAIRIPYTEDLFTPHLSIIPLQMLAYYVALERGCDVDKPRNLAKSVTVE